MNKAILEFNLEELDQKQSLKRCLKADDLCSSIWEFTRNSRKKLEWKIESDETLDNFDMLELVYKEFFEILEKDNINIDELYE